MADTPGVTRDRKEAEAHAARPHGAAGRYRGAGGSRAGDAGRAACARGREAAVAQADLVLFVIDARAGITPADEHFAHWLRRQGRPVLLVANKAEGRAGDRRRRWRPIRWAWASRSAVSAEHGEGIADLMSEIADRLPPRQPRRRRGRRTGR